MLKASVGISLVKVPVSDLARSLRFYELLFGCKPEFASDAHGWAQFNLGSLTIALYAAGFGEDDRRPGGSLDFHLLVSELDGLRQRLSARGACATGGLLCGANGSRSMDLTDPDGNVIRLCERLPSEERRLGTHVRRRRQKVSGVDPA